MFLNPPTLTFLMILRSLPPFVLCVLPYFLDVESYYCNRLRAHPIPCQCNQKSILSQSYWNISSCNQDYENNWFIRPKWCKSYERLVFVYLFCFFFQKHEACCSFMGVKCTNKGCKETPLQKDLQEHLIKECLMRTQLCEYCKTSFLFCKGKVKLLSMNLKRSG